jgi:hypothetical protein
LALNLNDFNTVPLFYGIIAWINSGPKFEQYLLIALGSDTKDNLVTLNGFMSSTNNTFVEVEALSIVKGGLDTVISILL